MQTVLDEDLSLCDCEPFAYLPAWWCAFLFQIISPRQLSVYTYLAMLGAKEGVARPTVRQIQADMGLYSDTVVFNAIRTLESYGLIRRLRSKPAGPLRKAYHRPSCESTLITLLEQKRIDADLMPLMRTEQSGKSHDVQVLTQDGLRLLLEARYEAYQQAPAAERVNVLIQLLREARLERRAQRADGFCACSQVDPLDDVLLDEQTAS
jgi:hypothetical protein